ncbi:hypothetical protein L9F63_003005 [Diploptera punctata]|uniref:Double-strand break repair protein n=1 Tax=Diploptera punctata TaxID=6984 RepID=A0AAD7ZRF2_DIPPU|nr:hypothetical protein L9F63_003005 [Diploptera punctata]
MNSNLTSEVPPEDILNILVASDIHLGYAEKDPERGEDSFITFEEILSIAQERNVDLILLGGDLFHDSKPTPKCIHRCMSLIRKYCMGDRPVAVEFLSDQAENFKHCVNPVVNYEDPNFNVSVPVFSIHGNHDDPSGYGRLSSLDILSVTGLVNYFGKWTEVTTVEISPLLMRKGETHFALYGLSYLKDERLARLFRDYNVKMLIPKEEQDKWFNLLVLHQNRVNRGPNNFITEEMLPSFLDLVIWGHEHECRIVPEWNEIREFYVSQPGSPVATSLCQAESVKKHVAVLNIYKKKFKMTPIPLKTVRPFVFDTLVLADCTLDTNYIKLADSVQSYITDHIVTLIDRAVDYITGDKRQPEKPLVRLRVEYTDEREMFNAVRFGNQYADKVANPSDMVIFRKHRINADKDKAKAQSDLDKDALQSIFERDDNPGTNERTVEQIVECYFTEEAPNQHLQILSIKGLAEAAARFINRGDKDALFDLVDHQIQKTVKHLLGKCQTEEEVDKQLKLFHEERLAKVEEEAKDACHILDNPSRKSTSKKDKNNAEILDSDSDDMTGAGMDFSISENPTKTRGRGRGRAAASGGRGSRARGGSRGRGQKVPAAATTSIKDAFSQQRKFCHRTVRE